MANLANALKEEVGTLVRKELRRQTADADKARAQYERDIATLKREVQELERALSSSDTPPGGPAVTRKKTSGDAASIRQAANAASASAGQSPQDPLSGDALKAHRERLGLSGDNYGKLVGVSELSIYNWEHGKARPRKSSVEALMAIRRIGKREAGRRLAALETPETQPQRSQSGVLQPREDFLPDHRQGVREVEQERVPRRGGDLLSGTEPAPAKAVVRRVAEGDGPVDFEVAEQESADEFIRRRVVTVIPLGHRPRTHRADALQHPRRCGRLVGPQRREHRGHVAGGEGVDAALGQMREGMEAHGLPSCRTSGASRVDTEGDGCDAIRSAATRGTVHGIARAEVDRMD